METCLFCQCILILNKFLILMFFFNRVIQICWKTKDNWTPLTINHSNKTQTCFYCNITKIERTVVMQPISVH